jgi:hypothetical protein
MLNKNKGENMTVTNKQFFDTMNTVDTQLYEIAKTLKSFNKSLNVEDLMLNVYESIENNVYKQLTDSNFKKQQKIKDDTIVS